VAAPVVENQPRNIKDIRGQTMVDKGAADSRNAFLERAIRKQLAAARRAAIDAEFAWMANDSTYQKEAVEVAEQFAEADWEALRAAERNT
jgi:hypothetical protein